MSTLLIKNARVVLADRITQPSNILCENGKITFVGDSKDLNENLADEIADAQGHYLAPGLIDLHFHGCGKFLINNGPNDLAEICKILPSHGVTGYLPTVSPSPKGQDAKLLASLAQVDSQGTGILGFHLEGPFLTMTGCLPKEALGQADPDRVRDLIDAAGDYPAIFSISPDFERILELISIMANGGTPVFITHTAADTKQTQAAINAGACHATHFYDVFPVPPESDPGVRPVGAVEAILADPRVSVDFILDGEHVDPVAVKMALQCKGPQKVCLITDANVGAGLPPGKHWFGQEEIEFKYPGAPARLTENARFPGALAGSGLLMDAALRNAIKMLDVDLPQAVAMASTNPARVLGLDNRKGMIKQGFDADLIMLDDSLRVTKTWVASKCVFSQNNKS